MKRNYNMEKRKNTSKHHTREKKKSQKQLIQSKKKKIKNTLINAYRCCSFTRVAPGLVKYFEILSLTEGFELYRYSGSYVFRQRVSVLEIQGVRLICIKKYDCDRMW